MSRYSLVSKKTSNRTGQIIEDPHFLIVQDDSYFAVIYG